MTVLMSGVNMFAMAEVMKVVLGWDLNFSIIVSSLAVAAYVALGGLRSAIFNEVLQFVLIWGGALLVPILGLVEAGGWTGFKAQTRCAISPRARSPTGDYTHLWRSMGHFSDNPMGIHWTGIVFGLGFAISFGYWTTDFLVVQRVLAANNLRSARMAPVIGSFFKMAVPFIVILPGLLGLVVLQNPDGSLMHLVGQNLATPGSGLHSYNEVLPLMMVRYLRARPARSWHHGADRRLHERHGRQRQRVFRRLDLRHLPAADHQERAATSTTSPSAAGPPILGVIISIGTAYLVMNAQGIMDYVQALFSFFISPLLGVVLMGMFWKRATKAGGFWGLLIGTLTSIGLWAWVYVDPGGTAIRSALARCQDHGREYVPGLVVGDRLHAGDCRRELV